MATNEEEGAVGGTLQLPSKVSADDQPGNLFGPENDNDLGCNGDVTDVEMLSITSKVSIILYKLFMLHIFSGFENKWTWIPKH